MASTTHRIPTGPFHLIYDDETFLVIATTVYDDGSFDVMPVDSTDPYADWTVYPGELDTIVTIEPVQAPAAVSADDVFASIAAAVPSTIRNTESGR